MPTYPGGGGGAGGRGGWVSALTGGGGGGIGSGDITVSATEAATPCVGTCLGVKMTLALGNSSHVFGTNRKPGLVPTTSGRVRSPKCICGPSVRLKGILVPSTEAEAEDAAAGWLLLNRGVLGCANGVFLT